MLVDLSRLRLHDRAESTGLCQDAAAVDAVRARWLAACGRRPSLKRWKSLSGKDKRRLLHTVALRADDDSPGGAYLTAYEQMDIDDVMDHERQSVEHVVPRSHINGRDPGDAEDDPVGWIVATRASNSRRGNKPLKLWDDEDGQMAAGTVRVDGEVHFAPPAAQRARLARKWLFLRATYADIDPPSRAQRRHAAAIVALARHDPPSKAELRVNAQLRARHGWANPLLEEGADKFYDDVAWRALVFGPYAC